MKRLLVTFILSTPVLSAQAGSLVCELVIPDPHVCSGSFALYLNDEDTFFAIHDNRRPCWNRPNGSQGFFVRGSPFELHETSDEGPVLRGLLYLKPGGARLELRNHSSVETLELHCYPRTP